MENIYTVEQARETGKSLFFGNESDETQKSNGLRLLLLAQRNGDPEAGFIIGKLILDKVLTPRNGDTAECALSIIMSSANKGYAPARAFINAFCLERYEKDISEKINNNQKSDKLLDFDGKPIRIDRTGVLTPIDVSLRNENGVNILDIKASINFIDTDSVEDEKKFRQAILEGFSMWQGRYEVFGGQPVEVRVDVAEDSRIYDCIYVIPLSLKHMAYTQAFTEKIGSRKATEKVEMISAEKRSFALAGRRWSVNSRKIIYIMCDDYKFNDYNEIRHVAKHEFGHALGLGDLYASKSDNLTGVNKGQFAELDSYYVSDKVYNLVMCDHHGPVSNNDIEMIILAFRENKMQNYQQQLTKKISEALGKGN